MHNTSEQDFGIFRNIFTSSTPVNISDNAGLIILIIYFVIRIEISIGYF